MIFVNGQLFLEFLSERQGTHCSPDAGGEGQFPVPPVVPPWTQLPVGSRLAGVAAFEVHGVVQFPGLRLHKQRVQGLIPSDVGQGIIQDITDITDFVPSASASGYVLLLFSHLGGKLIFRCGNLRLKNIKTHYKCKASFPRR